MGNSIEKTGKFYYGDRKFDESLLLENQIKASKDQKEANQLINKLLELDKQKQAEIDQKLERLELLPTGAKVMILPYPTNPYRRIVSKGGIVIDEGRRFNNPDTGEKDDLKQGIACAKVIEVGPECTSVIVGDDVFFDMRTVYPVPFLDLGYKLISHESQILVILNEGLKQRFNMTS